MAIILDGTNGAFLPTWTTATRPASPANGEIGYNSTTAQLDQYVGGAWSSVPTGSAAAATPTALGTVYAKQTTGGGSPYLTAFGSFAATNTTGAENTAVGNNALFTNVSGIRNSAFGVNTLYYNTGGYNVAVGMAALQSNTSANENSALGYNAGFSNTTGNDNVAVGSSALYTNSTSGNNVAVGRRAAYSNLSGGNTAIGATAFETNSSGNNATCVGYQAGYSNTTDTELTAFGYRAAFSNTTGSGGGRTTAIGVQALEANTTGYNNCAVGWRALNVLTTNSLNAAFGTQAGQNCTGTSNLFIGAQCNTEATTGSNNVCVGAYNGGSRIFSLVAESNRVLIGSNAITNAYVQVAWTITSDARDKTDIVAAPYGLNFVNELRPIEYRWDRRSKYENGQPDGTHKEDKKVLGFLAQEVIELEKKYGAVEKDLLIADDEEVGMLKVTETKMIPILVKAIQELKADFDQLKAKVA